MPAIVRTCSARTVPTTVGTVGTVGPKTPGSHTYGPDQGNMPQLILTNSKLVAEVDEEDYLFVCFESWGLSGKYVTGKTKEVHNKYLHHVIADRIGLVIVETVDHIDRNPLNNKRDNLRAATYTENLLNRAVFKHSSSGERHIFWCAQKNKWQVEINTTNFRKHVGFYATVADAVVARDTFLKTLA